MSNIVKHTRKIFINAGGSTDPTLITRLETLENNEKQVIYWAQISSASGTITIPTGATVILDQFQGGADAFCSTISNGQPSGIFPQTAGGLNVDVSSFDALGNFTLSGTPSAFDVALIYVLNILEKDWANLDLTKVVETYELDLSQPSTQIVVGTGNGVTSYANFASDGAKMSINAPLNSVYYGGVLASYNSRQSTNGIERHFLAQNDNYGKPAYELRTNGASGITNTQADILLYGYNVAPTNPITGTTINASTGLLRIISNYGSYTNTPTSTAPISLEGTAIYGIAGVTSTNYGFKQDNVGLRIDQIANLNTANTKEFQVGTRVFAGSDGTNGSIWLGGVTPDTNNYTIRSTGTT